MSPTEKLQRYFLPKTLEHAVKNSSFYEERFPNWQEVHGPEDLHKLPLLLKKECVSHQEHMRCGKAPTDFGSVSSGTTRVGHELFRVERNSDEADALDELYDMLGAEEPDDAPLILHILTPNHGLPAGAAPANTLRVAWASSTHVCDLILNALLMKVGDKQVSVMRVSVSILKQLTAYFSSRDVDFARFAVREIGTNAALVTSRWRDVFESTWQAKVFDNYSLSEFKTPATECDHCDFYHFSEPPLIAEFLDPITHEPTDDEHALLVLTGLYPYVQRTPLIRYVSGDLVQRGPMCEGRQSLRFRGRVHQSFFESAEGRTRYLLFSAVLEDIIDHYSDVARHIHPIERAGELMPYTVGQAKFSAHMDDEKITLKVGTLFEPALFKERSRALTREIEAEIHRRHPDLVASERELIIELKHAAGSDDWNEWFVKYLA